MNYLVVWEMEISGATSPEEAARRAREYQKDTSLPEPVMDVYLCSDEGEHTRVDLEEIAQEATATD